MAQLLFTPLQLGQKMIKNRFCFPSVGLLQDADPITGCPTESRTKHYAQIAQGGAGLIVVGITSIQRDARLRPGEFGLWDDGPIGGFQRMTDAIHHHGAAALVQLHHAGVRVMPAVCRDRVAPSALPAFGARAMTLDEIYRLREDFIAAAVRAQKAGFDGVELHAAHGYLLSLFASPLYNHRRDAYGGTPENRVRLQTEIIQGIHAACGGAFIVSSRIGGNEPGFAQGVEIARMLEAAGADSLSVSFGLDAHYCLETPYWRPTPWPPGFRGNSVVYAASLIRRQVRIPVTAVRSIHTAERGEWLLANGHADLIAYARPMLTNPDFVERVRRGIQPETECLDCPVCQWFSQPKACPVEQKYGRDFYAGPSSQKENLWK